ncbi:hypothetical protein F5051DRAFT_411565 [Lentinula edodes]|nr:hypothetical protein F5051DRAFT_411565 [Lentinula edodes]
MDLKVNFLPKSTLIHPLLFHFPCAKFTLSLCMRFFSGMYMREQRCFQLHNSFRYSVGCILGLSTWISYVYLAPAGWMYINYIL